MGREASSRVTIPLKGAMDVLGVHEHPAIDVVPQIGFDLDIGRYLEPRSLAVEDFVIAAPGTLQLDRALFRIHTLQADPAGALTHVFTPPAHFVACIRWLSMLATVGAGAPTGSGELFQRANAGRFTNRLPGGSQFAQIALPWLIGVEKTIWLQEGQQLAMSTNPATVPGDTVNFFSYGQILLYPAGVVPAFCT